jgi:soluble lytic murein transglycosylase-like protein
MGQRVTIHASRLWAHVSEGELAPAETLVVETARRLGVDPALALAVAWQESRLDQSARSVTGAVGIMQVEPDTARIVARDLGTGLDIGSAPNNVTAGVVWLRSLLQSYGGDRSSALAAYYEGPSNLAREGYLAGTYGYVAHALAVRAALLAASPGLHS